MKFLNYLLTLNYNFYRFIVYDRFNLQFMAIDY